MWKHMIETSTTANYRWFVNDRFMEICVLLGQPTERIVRRINQKNDDGIEGFCQSFANH